MKIEEIQTLPFIKANTSKQYLVLFWNYLKKVKGHFVEDVEIYNYVQCGLKKDQDCILCQVIKKYDEFYLLPAFNQISGEFVALHIPSDRRIEGLKAQIDNFLKSTSLPIGLSIQKKAKTSKFAPDCFDVRKCNMLDNYSSDTAEKVIEMIESGDIRLRDCYKKYNKKELLGIPAIRQKYELETGCENDEDDDHAHLSKIPKPKKR